MREGAFPADLPFAGALQLLSDERLVGRAVAGDRRAFGAIYRRYHQELYRFALAILGDADDAADVLQATMVKAMLALPGERRQIQLRPWLYRIAHNESVELLRRRRAADRLSPEVPAAAPQPHEEAEQRSRLRTLLRDLEELPDRQRGALVMRELSGCGFEEIGLALDASPAVVRQTIYEARSSLRQMEEGRSLDCKSVTLALSENDGRVSRRRDLRAHLRHCPPCRDFQQGIERRRTDLAAITPLPAVVASTVLKGAAGVLGSEGAGGLSGSLAGGLAGGVGASAVVKSAATVAVVVTLGVSVADRSGLVSLGASGGGGREAASARSSAPSGGSAGAESRQPAPGRGAGEPAFAVTDDGGAGDSDGSVAGRASHGTDSHAGGGSDPTAPLADLPAGGRGGEGADGPPVPTGPGPSNPGEGGGPQGGGNAGQPPSSPSSPPAQPPAGPAEQAPDVPVPQPPDGQPGQPPVPSGTPEPPGAPGGPGEPPRGPPESTPSPAPPGRR